MHALDVSVLIAYLAGVLFLGYRAGSNVETSTRQVVEHGDVFRDA